jgi:glycosyltransferase involved in cell wall biosynthesis
MDDYKDLNVTPKPNHLIFSGSFTYDANYEAMHWFVREVYPRVLEQMSDVHLLITGDHANKSLPSLKNITLTGYVNDIKSLIASCSVSIAPLLSGGGTRLKILEAMAIGVPVVATSKGAEGLGAQDGEHLLVSDDPDAFAKGIVRILRDKNFHDHLSTHASHFVKKNYDWSAVMPRFMKLVDQVASR